MPPNLDPTTDRQGFDAGEVAALIVSLVALGPTATESARTGMRKLLAALVPNA